MAKKQTDNTPKPLRGIRNPDLYGDTSRQTAQQAAQIASLYNRAKIRNYQASQGQVGWDADIHNTQLAPEDTRSYGQSMFDVKPLFQATPEDIQNERAEEQPWYAQLAAGITKGTVLAGTTFVNGTYGLLYGAASAIANGKFSNLWNNPVTETMNQVNQGMENAMPVYKSTWQQEAPWYSPDSWFNTAWLGDDLIKNIGFTVGAIYSGGVWNKLLQATKVLPLMNKGMSKLFSLIKGTPTNVNMSGITGSLISAIGEGSAEAMQNSNDWANLQLQKLNDSYNQQVQLIKQQYGNTELGAELLRKADSDHNAAIQEIDLKKRQMGNLDLLMNIPILTASNFLQFAKLYGRGFTTAKRFKTIMNADGTFSKPVESTAYKTIKKIGSIIKSPLSEGMEEVNQQAASNVSGDYKQMQLQDFYARQRDPQSRQDTASFIQANLDGFRETYGANDTWAQFLVGAVTGAMGLPGVKRKANGKLGLTWNGGIKEAFENDGSDAIQQETIDYLNKRGSSKAIQDRIKGFVRHKSYDADKQKAVDANDEKAYHDAEDKQLISDIIHFDRAGQLDYYKQQVEAAFDTSDENIDQVMNNDPLGIYKGMSREEVKQKLEKDKQLALDTIDDYAKKRVEVESATGGVYNDDTVETLTFGKVYAERQSKRMSELAENSRSVINTIADQIDKQIPRQNIQEQNKLKELSSALRQAASSKNPFEVISGKDFNAAYIDELYDKGLIGRDAYSQLSQMYQDYFSIQKDLVKNNIENAKAMANPTNLEQKLEETEQKQQEDETKKEEEAERKSFTYYTTDDAGNTIEATGDNIEDYLLGQDRKNNAQTILNNYDNLSEQDKFEALSILHNSDSEDAQKALFNIDYKTNYEVKLFQLQDNGSITPEEREAAMAYSPDTMDDRDTVTNPEINEAQVLSNINERIANGETPAQAIANERNAAYISSIVKHSLNNGARFKDRVNKKYIGKPIRGMKVKAKYNKEGKFTEFTINSMSGLKEGGGVQYNAKSLVDNPPTESMRILKIRQTDDGRVFADVAWEYPNGTTSLSKTPIQLKYNPLVTGVNFSQSNAEDPEDTGADAVQKSPSAEASPVKTDNIEPASNPQAVAAENNERVANPNQQNKGTSGQYQFLMPAVSEYDLTNRDSAGRIKPVPLGVTKKGYADIWNLMNKLGAFENINKGKVQAGDTITFEISRSQDIKDFEERNKTYFPDGKPLILIKATNKNGTFIIGTLNRSNSKEYAGLDNLMQDIWDKYKAAKSPDNYVYPIKTKVNQVLDGQVKLGDDIKDSSKIDNIDNAELGIVTNGGVLVTSNNVKVKNFEPTSLMAGRTYLLIKGSSGEYIPISMGVHHFAADEWNLQDKADTPIGKKIQELVTKIAQFSVKKLTDQNYQNLGELREALGKYLYLGNSSFNISEDGRKLIFAVNTGIQGEEGYRNYIYEIPLYSNNSVPVTIGDNGGFNLEAAQQQAEQPRSVEEIAASIINTLYRARLPLQIDKNSLQDKGYVQQLIQSDVMMSNLSDGEVHNSTVTINPIIDGTAQEALPAITTGKKEYSPMSTGTAISLGNNDFVAYNRGSTIQFYEVSNGKESTVPIDTKGARYNSLMAKYRYTQLGDNNSDTENGIFFDRAQNKYFDTQHDFKQVQKPEPQKAPPAQAAVETPKKSEENPLVFTQEKINKSFNKPADVKKVQIYPLENSFGYKITLNNGAEIDTIRNNAGKWTLYIQGKPIEDTQQKNAFIKALFTPAFINDNNFIAKEEKVVPLATTKNDSPVEGDFKGADGVTVNPETTVKEYQDIEGHTITTPDNKVIKPIKGQYILSEGGTVDGNTMNAQIYKGPVFPLFKINGVQFYFARKAISYKNPATGEVSYYYKRYIIGYNGKILSEQEEGPLKTPAVSEINDSSFINDKLNKLDKYQDKLLAAGTENTILYNKSKLQQKNQDKEDQQKSEDKSKGKVVKASLTPEDNNTDQKVTGKKRRRPGTKKAGGYTTKKTVEKSTLNNATVPKGFEGIATVKQTYDSLSAEQKETLKSNGISKEQFDAYTTQEERDVALTCRPPF